MIDKSRLNSILKPRISYIIILSLMLQLSIINWGLVSHSPAVYGLGGFYVDEPEIAGLPLRMLINNDLNPHWFIQPSGYIYAVFIPLYISKFFIQLNLLNAMILGRLVSIMFTLLMILILFYTGKELFDSRIGLIASFLMAINPYYFSYSIYVKQDSMTVFFVTLSIYYFIKYIKYGNINLNYLSMFMAGIANSTKSVAGLILIIFTMIFTIKNYKSAKNKRKISKYAISLFFYIIGFILLTPYSVLSTKEFLNGIFSEFTHYSTLHPGYGPQSFFTHFEILLGLWELPYGTVAGMGALIIFILIGFFFFFKDFKKLDIKIQESATVLLFWILLIVLTFSLIIKVKMANQMLMAIPSLMIFAAYGIKRFMDGNKYKISRIILITIIIFLVFTYTTSIIISRQNDNRYYSAQWLTENVDANEPIATTPYTYVPSKFNNVTIIWPRNVNLSLLEEIQEEDYDYIVLSSTTYKRYFYFKDSFPEKYEFFNKLINNETKYKLIKKFTPSETNRQRTITFGINSFITKEYHGEVEIYILKNIKK